MPSYLLDTNAAISLMASEREIRELVAKADEIYLSSIVLGELYYGAEKSGRVAQNVQRVDELAERFSVLDCDIKTARIFGQVRQQLKLKGHLNQANDIWIAATALQYNLILLTRDADFNHVDGLTIASW